MKSLKYALVCLGVLVAFTGCGKESEENVQLQSTEITTPATETDGGSDFNTETEAVSASQTESSTESDTKQTEVSEIDTDATTEATGSETDKQNSVSTATVSDTEQPQAYTLAENDTPVQTDAPAQEPVSTEPPAPQDIPTELEPVVTEPPTTEAPVSGGVSDLTITYQGQTLSIGDNAENFVKAVKPNFEESAPSCYGNGENINYYYDDITVYVWNENNNYMVYSIDVNAPGVAPAKGYDIGSTADFEGQKIIDCGDDCNIIIAEAGGQVITISYNKNL